MSNNLSKTLNGRYLNTYLIFAGCLCALCILGMVFIGIVAYEKNTWSYGLIVLLFLSLVMAILAVISLVAYYREKGRYHERIIPLDIAELSDKNDNLNAQNKSLSAEISKLRELFGKDWEDGYKETKNTIVKTFCEKVDSEFKVVKEKHKGELDKILENIKNIDLNQIINQISNDGGASGSEPAEKAETSTKEESEKVVEGEDQKKTIDGK